MNTLPFLNYDAITTTQIQQFLNQFKKSMTPQQEVALSVEIISYFISVFAKLFNKESEIELIPEKDHLTDTDIQSFLQKMCIPLEKYTESLAQHNHHMNIWNCLGLEELELRNCRVLAWFLDPHGDHGQGNRFLRCLSHLAPEIFDAQIVNQKDFIVQYEQRYSETERIDISLISPLNVVVFEVKINAIVDLNQLERYWELLQNTQRRVTGILLTKKRDPPPPGKHRFHSLSWSDIACAFRFLADENHPDHSKNPFIRELSRQYATFINKFLERN